MTFKNFKRLKVKINIIGDGDVGTKEGEFGPFNIIMQSTNVGIPLMVADSTKVEPQTVHQLYHGVIDRVVLVIDGIACTVIASRKEQQVGIDGTQAVDHRRKLGELVDAGMHVIHR